jgi:hypothetical protein
MGMIKRDGNLSLRGLDVKSQVTAGVTTDEFGLHEFEEVGVIHGEFSLQDGIGVRLSALDLSHRGDFGSVVLGNSSGFSLSNVLKKLNSIYLFLQ